ncbi:hypothetical protein BGX26_002964, partial [Mortierella sp. AD094]
MLPPYGSQSVQLGALSANSHCFHKYNATTDTYTNDDLAGLPGPSDLILSANYAEDLTKNYRQITGCMDISAWGLNLNDTSAMIDSVGYT